MALLWLLAGLPGGTLMAPPVVGQTTADRSLQVEVRAPIGTPRAIVLAVKEAFETQEPLPGVPLPEAVTVHLSEALSSEVTGGAALAFRAIVLPADRIAGWSGEKLYRTARHELAHIALYEFLGGAEVPVWIREGYSEWVGGRTSCAERLSLQLAVLTHNVKNGQGFSLERLAGVVGSSLRYLLYRTAFDLLESDIGVAEVLSAVATEGYPDGLELATAQDLPGFESRWNNYLLAAYGRSHSENGCEEQ